MASVVYLKGHVGNVDFVAVPFAEKLDFGHLGGGDHLGLASGDHIFIPIFLSHVFCKGKKDNTLIKSFMVKLSREKLESQCFESFPLSNVMEIWTTRRIGKEFCSTTFGTTEELLKNVHSRQELECIKMESERPVLRSLELFTSINWSLFERHSSNGLN